MLSGYYGLYSEQKIVYSKFRTEWIDKRPGDPYSRGKIEGELTALPGPGEEPEIAALPDQDTPGEIEAQAQPILLPHSRAPVEAGKDLSLLFLWDAGAAVRDPDAAK